MTGPLRGPSAGMTSALLEKYSRVSRSNILEEKIETVEPVAGHTHECITMSYRGIQNR